MGVMLKTHDILYIVAGLLVAIGIIQQIFWRLRRRKQDRERNHHFEDFEDHFRTLHSTSSTPHRVRSCSPTRPPLLTTPIRASEDAGRSSWATENSRGEVCTSERAGSSRSTAGVSTIQHPDPVVPSRRSHASSTTGPHRSRACSSRSHSHNFHSRSHSRLGASRVPERSCYDTTTNTPGVRPRSNQRQSTSSDPPSLSSHYPGAGPSTSSAPTSSAPPSYYHSSIPHYHSSIPHILPASPPEDEQMSSPIHDEPNRQARISSIEVGKHYNPPEVGVAGREPAPEPAPGRSCRTPPSQAPGHSETPEHDGLRLNHARTASNIVVVLPPPAYSPPSVPS